LDGESVPPGRAPAPAYTGRFRAGRGPASAAWAWLRRSIARPPAGNATTRSPLPCRAGVLVPVSALCTAHEVASLSYRREPYPGRRTDSGPHGDETRTTPLDRPPDIAARSRTKEKGKKSASARSGVVGPARPSILALARTLPDHGSRALTGGRQFAATARCSASHFLAAPCRPRPRRPHPFRPSARAVFEGGEPAAGPGPIRRPVRPANDSSGRHHSREHRRTGFSEHGEREATYFAPPRPRIALAGTSAGRQRLPPLVGDVLRPAVQRRCSIPANRFTAPAAAARW